MTMNATILRITLSKPKFHMSESRVEIVDLTVSDCDIQTAQHRPVLAY